MEGLQDNHSLTFLDLSHNKVCEEENLNFLHPEFTTGGLLTLCCLWYKRWASRMCAKFSLVSRSTCAGGEAVAELLRTNDTIKELRLSWNAIRGDSAVAIAKALRANSGLTSLDLSYNTVSVSGGTRRTSVTL